MTKKVKTTTPKAKTALQVAFWGDVVLVALMIIASVPFTNIAPFLIFLGLVGRGAFYGKSFKVATIVLCGAMMLLNLAIPSFIDVLVWGIGLILVLI